MVVIDDIVEIFGKMNAIDSSCLSRSVRCRYFVTTFVLRNHIGRAVIARGLIDRPMQTFQLAVDFDVPPFTRQMPRIACLYLQKI